MQVKTQKKNKSGLSHKCGKDFQIIERGEKYLLTENHTNKTLCAWHGCEFLYKIILEYIELFNDLSDNYNLKIIINKYKK